jgi:GNAT superfamily N-acetyltransferase
MFEHTVVRKGTVGVEDAEVLLTIAVASMGNIPLVIQQRFFTESFLCFLEDIGELHILHKDNYLHAFCFILDKYGTDRAARYLHIMSVVKSSREQGLGRQLIERVISTNGDEPITLESFPDSKGFFEKVGFKSKSASLGHGMTAMYMNGDGFHEQFKFLVPNAEQLDIFGTIFIVNRKRLGIALD